MADRLEALLSHFGISAQVFHAGALCGINALQADSERGQLHLVRSGAVEVQAEGLPSTAVSEPSLLLFPRPLAHRFVTDPERGADFTCAHLRFDGGVDTPLVQALPAFICLPLRELHGAGAVLELLFEEAFAQNCGRQAVLNRLFEVVLIQVLRQLMETGTVQVGLLAGLAHPRLRHALVAVHAAPAELWTLDGLAARAQLSRSLFARSFRDTVGCTPGEYLQRWRIALVQRGLRQGRALKQLVDEVGYGSEAALSRAFKAQTGQAPRRWSQAQASG